MESTQQHGVATIWREGSSAFLPLGSDTELLAFLPLEATGIPVGRYDCLQAAYDGRLDIEHGNGSIVIGRKFLAYSNEDVKAETERFCNCLKTHLGLSTKRS